MTCPHCGRPNPDDIGECAACGASLAGERTVTSGPFLATVTSYPAAGSWTAAPPSAAALSRLAAGTLLGTRYEILSVLGEGGMGTVYKAQDRELGRLVALKVIRHEMASRPEILERFKREILLASQVTHRNVLRIHDFGEAGDIKFISMSFIEGSNLKALLEREGPLPLERGFALARQIGEALQAAHDAGIVHRDLKPQNILIDGDGNAYIADFGISRSLAEGGTMTETGAILGTVDYMAPEQARGETPDHRGDLYSFGIILYEMFTGTLPFRASNALSVMMKRLHEDAPTVRRVRPEIPAWLSAVVARALQRDPDDRYQSAGDLLRDIDRQRASRSSRRFVRPRYLVPAAALAAAAILALLPVRVPWPPWGRSAPPPPKTSLVILPFRNATGNPSYDGVGSGLTSLVWLELFEARSLRLVGEDRAHQALASLEIPGNTEPSPVVMRRMAALLGAENVLAGSLVKIADRLRIDASLLAAGTSRDGRTAGATAPGAISIVVDGAGDQAIFTMVDDLTRHVRDRLAVARGFLERRHGTAGTSTRSVAALSMYGEGLALARAGQEMEAVQRLEQALLEDPQFHVARALLAETYDRLGRPEKALEEAVKAASDLGSASPCAAARIRAVQARLSGDSRQALEAYGRLCAIAPNHAEAFLDLAAEQEKAGQLKDARQSVLRVLALDPKHPDAHHMLGRLLYRLGDGTEALEEFGRALALHSETGHDQGRAAVLNGLGDAYRHLLRRPDEALGNYQAALEIGRQIGDRRGVASTLLNLALAQSDLGRHDEGIRSATEALEISREIGDRDGLASGYAELGDIYQMTGRPEDALRAYQDSLKIVREIDDPTSLSRSLVNVGYVNSVLGRYVEAFFFLKEALAKRREIGDKAAVVRSLIDLGAIERVQGRFEAAIQYHAEGLSLAKEIGDKPRTLVLLAGLSDIHQQQGAYGPALSLLNDMQALGSEVSERPILTSCLIVRAAARRRLGDFGGAETALQEALRLAREMNNPPLVAEALAGQAALLLERGQRGRALPVAREAVTRALATRDHRLILLARLQAAEAAQDVPEIEDLLGRAASSGLAPMAVAAHLALAREHLAAGRTREAGLAAEQALKAGAPMHLRDLLFQASHLAGMALQAQGKNAAAADAYGAGLVHLEEMRRDLSGADLKQFLGRPETAEFAGDAGLLFPSLNRGRDADRLRALLQP